MSKKQLVEVVREKTGLAPKDATAAVTAVFEFLTETMAAGEKFNLTGFGTFEGRTVPAGKRRNPQTGEMFDVAQKRAPKFSAGVTLKQQVNGERELESAFTAPAPAEQVPEVAAAPKAKKLVVKNKKKAGKKK